MRLIVLADTHIPDRGEDLPPSIIKECMKADLIIHAGDFTSLDFYNQLKKIKPLKAVYGNMDCCSVRDLLKEKEVFKIEGRKIGLIHGYGAAACVLENIEKIFNNTFDLVIFGHTHTPVNKKKGETCFFNPGSPTDKIFADYNSFGIIEIDKQKQIKTHIEKL